MKSRAPPPKGNEEPCPSPSTGMKSRVPPPQQVMKSPPPPEGMKSRVPPPQQLNEEPCPLHPPDWLMKSRVPPPRRVMATRCSGRTAPALTVTVRRDTIYGHPLWRRGYFAMMCFLSANHNCDTEQLQPGSSDPFPVPNDL
ncbi:unnamed protein product [Arctogadus glacialis]